MALFKRADRSEPAPIDLATVLLQGEDMIEQLGRAHGERWGLGSAQRWDLDQVTATITWTFADRSATAPAQILGSHSPGAGTWQWGWANSSLQPSVRRDAERVQQWAKTHDLTGLLAPTVEGDETLAATMAAIAVRVTEATGFYRAAAGASTVFITFGPVTITEADGRSSTFGISVHE